MLIRRLMKKNPFTLFWGCSIIVLSPIFPCIWTSGVPKVSLIFYCKLSQLELLSKREHLPYLPQMHLPMYAGHLPWTSQSHSSDSWTIKLPRGLTRSTQFWDFFYPLPLCLLCSVVDSGGENKPIICEMISGQSLSGPMTLRISHENLILVNHSRKNKAITSCHTGPETIGPVTLRISHENPISVNHSQKK